MQIRRILTLLTIGLSFLCFSCSASTGEDNGSSSGNNLGSLDDYMFSCDQLLITKGEGNKNQKAFFTFQDGKGDCGQLISVKINGKDEQLISYLSFEDITVTKCNEIWNGKDPQNPEIDKYFVNQSQESRTWIKENLNYLLFESSNFIYDLLILEKNDKQYLINDQDELQDNSEIIKYEVNGVYSTSDLPKDKVDLSEYYGEEPGTEDYMVNITGKFVFGNKTYYLTNE